MRNGAFLRAAFLAIGVSTWQVGACQLKYVADKAVLDTVVVSDTIQSAVLYERAREWMLRNLKASDNQVSLEDDSKTRLIGTANLLLPGKKGPDKSIHTDRVLNFKLSIFLREGRYRVVAENIVYSYRFVRGTADLPIRNTAEELFIYLRTTEEKGRPKAIEAAREPIAELNAAISVMLQSLQNSMIGERDLHNGDW